MYNAINGTFHVDPEALEIVTLENAIYMNMKNDLAFLMAFSLNIYEHQSTNNPNMPLRDLIYVAKEYQKLIDGRKFYSSKKIYIPAPRFVMLYNGTEDLPDKFELKLSDLYNPAVTEPELELKVTVYNINYGNNKKLMERCQPLKEYAIYVDKVRKFNKTMPIKEAVICAVEECIKEGILRDFLISQKREVIAMSIYEYDEEAVLAMLAEEYREDGIEIGMERGEILKVVSVIRRMLTKGMSYEAMADILDEDITVVRGIADKLSEDSTITDGEIADKLITCGDV